MDDQLATASGNAETARVRAAALAVDELVPTHTPMLWQVARAAGLGRPIGTVDDGPESSHLRLLLQRTIREGYDSETQDGRPASSLISSASSLPVRPSSVASTHTQALPASQSVA